MKDNTSLDYNKIIKTIEQLEKRINERFPNAGLKNVCRDFRSFSQTIEKNIEWISKPNIWLRVLTYGVISVAIIGIVYSIFNLNVKLKGIAFKDIVALLESITNEIVLLGAAIFFLVTLETRIKRSKSIKSLNKLRAIAHVVDMHQLTKDPNLINDHSSHNTQSSPKRSFTQFELQRYLEYCSEILALIAKVAALYPQSLPDDVVVRVANEIEMLTSGISRKIWQKLILLNESENHLIQTIEATETTDLNS